MKNKGKKYNSFTHVLKFITGILSWVVLVLLVMIAGFLLYYFVSMKIYAQKGENFRPPISLYTILTQSMVPNINPDDVIVDLTIKNPEDIKVGDVITFISTATLTKGMTITHRVVDIKQENGEYLFYTKGDANLPQDMAPAKFSNVLGKVLFRIPKLGLLQHFLATKGGWLIVVVIPALLIIISDILKIFRLKTVKDEVNVKLTQEEKKMKDEELRKEETRQNLISRYSEKRGMYEPDPIPIKEYVRLSKDNRFNVSAIDSLEDLPKLRPNDIVKEDVSKKIKRKRKVKKK